MYTCKNVVIIYVLYCSEALKKLNETKADNEAEPQSLKQYLASFHPVKVALHPY